MTIKEMLLEPLVHMPPLAALEGLSTEDAFRAPAAGVHHVAAVLAHMEFWQAWFLGRCDGSAAAMASSAAEGWPPVSPAEWPPLVGRFRSGLERAVALGEAADRLSQPIVPPIELPPLAGYAVRDALIHVAQHNSHHLGQIIVIRQLLGRWPPPAGRFTW